MSRHHMKLYHRKQLGHADGYIHSYSGVYIAEFQNGFLYGVNPFDETSVSEGTDIKILTNFKLMI